MPAFSYASAQLQQLAIHFIGNPTHDETLQLSQAPIPVDQEVIAPLLIKYFLSSFKSEEFYQFHHEANLSLNPLYTFSKDIFHQPDRFFDLTKNIAHHLFEVSSHPMVHSGELYIAHFTGIEIDGVERDMLGYFKSENKETFLKIYPNASSYQIDPHEGINIQKLDKGCLVFQDQEENGYKVLYLDQRNRDEAAQFWKDQFLKIQPRADHFQHTKQYMQLTHNFIRHKLKEDYEMDKVAEIDLVNRSMDFFKNRETFDFNTFAAEVMQQPDVVESFRGFKKDYQHQQGLDIADEFDIHPSAVKKQAKVYKSVLKLDKNFHIYIHGNRDYIQKGFDPDRGLNYYQVFFKEES